MIRATTVALITIVPGAYSTKPESSEPGEPST